GRVPHAASPRPFCGRAHGGLGRHLGAPALRRVRSHPCRDENPRLQHMGRRLEPHLHLYPAARREDRPRRRRDPRGQEREGVRARLRARNHRQGRAGKGVRQHRPRDRNAEPRGWDEMTESTKTAAAPGNAPETGVLHWDVFVTPGIPIVTRDKPPGIRETFFQAMASTLIYGVRDAVLVDAFMTVEQAGTLADWVAARGRNLTSIYITHGHGDHWFGVGTLLERFPNARVVATPNTVRTMRQNGSPEALERVWKVSFPDQIPDRLVIAEELEGHVIDLEGQDLVAVELGHTDTDDTTCLHVPSIGLVVAGDAAYNDVHLYLAESDA